MFEELIGFEESQSDFYTTLLPSYFCTSPDITKTQYVTIWKKLKKESKFSEAKLFSSNVTDIIRRLQTHKVVITVSKPEIPGQLVRLYCSCTSKDNTFTLFELSIFNANKAYAEIKYKNTMEMSDTLFETTLSDLLSLQNNVNDYELLSR